MRATVDEAARVLYTFEKPARDRWHQSEFVRAIVKRRDGRDVFELRSFYADRDGELRPAPRGILLPIEMLGEFENAVGAIRAAVPTGVA